MWWRHWKILCTVVTRPGKILSAPSQPSREMLAVLALHYFIFPPEPYICNHFPLEKVVYQRRRKIHQGLSTGFSKEMGPILRHCRLWPPPATGVYVTQPRISLNLGPILLHSPVYTRVIRVIAGEYGSQEGVWFNRMCGRISSHHTQAGWMCGIFL